MCFKMTIYKIKGLNGVVIFNNKNEQEVYILNGAPSCLGHLSGFQFRGYDKRKYIVDIISRSCPRGIAGISLGLNLS